MAYTTPWSYDERIVTGERPIKKRTRTDPRKISEKVFQSEVRKMALIHGWKYYHTFNSIKSVQGFPDCVMVKGKRIVFAELKSEKGKVTPWQRDWLDAFTEAAEAYLWRPSDIDTIWEILSK